MEKKYKLKSDEIERLVPDIGFAFVSDMITVEGKNVAYMVRQQASRDDDSGWVFYGGGETQEYIDDFSNTSKLSVNTIANYDPEIIRFLTYPPGTEIERNNAGRLRVTTAETKLPEVIFLPPADPGPIDINKSWSFNVSSRMLKRFDKGSVVVWRPGFTIWSNCYDANGWKIKDRVNKIIETASPDKMDFLEVAKNNVHKVRYRLQEVIDEKEQNAICIFALTEDQEIHMVIYFDHAEALSEIDEIWESLEDKDIQTTN